MNTPLSVLVTGAARGIGAAVARVFAEDGANLYLVDMNGEMLTETAENLRPATSGKVQRLTANVANEEAVAGIFREIEGPAPDVIVNCAGISTAGLMIDISGTEWDRVMAVNTRGTFLVSRYGAKAMIDTGYRDGRIINISSQASKTGERGNGVYCASKAAVNMITQVMGLELAEYGIKVNAICPGYVRTEILEQVFRERGPLEGMTPEEYEGVLTARVPARRLAMPEDVARLVRFLAGEDADYITGVSITQAGGTTLI
jgi:NAD(P)-dependent dehydrogenase (short-subunit alcohol dehydrogenase family)